MSLSIKNLRSAMAFSHLQLPRLWPYALDPDDAKALWAGSHELAQACNLGAEASEEGVCSDEGSVRAVVRRGGKSRIDPANRSGVDVPDLQPEGTGSFGRQIAQINSTWYESSVPRRIRLLTHVRQTSLS
jgi:hypothetical protein